MRQEDLDWFEENWHKGRPPKKSITNNKEYNIQKFPHLWNDIEWLQYENRSRIQNNWKKHRKTQYRVKPERKDKKRKAWYKEHWRFKSPVETETWAWRQQHKNSQYDSYCTWGQWWSAEGFVKSLKAGDKIKSKHQMMLVTSKGYNYYRDEEFVRARPIYKTKDWWWYDRERDEYEFEYIYTHRRHEIINVRDFIKRRGWLYYHQNKY
jgi:hypothetical protein